MKICVENCGRFPGHIPPVRWASGPIRGCMIPGVVPPFPGMGEVGLIQVLTTAPDVPDWSLSPSYRRSESRPGSDNSTGCSWLVPFSFVLWRWVPSGWVCQPVSCSLSSCNGEILQYQSYPRGFCVMSPLSCCGIREGDIRGRVLLGCGSGIPGGAGCHIHPGGIHGRDNGQAHLRTGVQREDGACGSSGNLL